MLATVKQRLWQLQSRPQNLDRKGKCMSLQDYSKLEYWLSDLDRKVDDYDLELHIAEIQLRAVKDGIDPTSREVIAVVKEFERAVKAHNKPFDLLSKQSEEIGRYRTQLAILDGKRSAKSASQRKFLSDVKRNPEEVRNTLTTKLAELELERNGNPAYLLSQKQVKPRHAQISDITGKPGWVRIECAGGCGRHVALREKKVSPASFYVCASKISGQQCRESLPPCEPGQISSMEFNAAAHFMGITYKWPTPAQSDSVKRAQGIWAAGVTLMALHKAMKI